MVSGVERRVRALQLTENEMLNAIKRWWNKPAREIQELCQLAEAFARADEREACAKVCEQQGRMAGEAMTFYTATGQCAAAIRARSNDGGKRVDD